MGYLKYGKDRYQPTGHWVQTSYLTNVAGVSFRKRAMLAFARAVRRAEDKGLGYGLRLLREPNNKHDPNAIAIYGFADVKGWFRKNRREWHIGYVPAYLAEDVTLNLIDAGVPTDIELYQIVEGIGDYYEVQFFILAPPGYGVAKRFKKDTIK